jgi:integrase
MRKLLMSWNASRSRWEKMFKGTRFYWYPDRHGQPPSKEGSWRAANDFWRNRKTELDQLGRQPKPGSPEAVQRLLEAWAGRPIVNAEEEAQAINEIMTYYRDHRPPQELIECVLGPQEYARVRTETVATLDRLAPLPQSIGGQFVQWYEGQKLKVSAGEISPDRADTNRIMLKHFVDQAGEHVPAGSITEETWRSFATFSRSKVAAGGWSSDYAASVMRVARSFIRSLWESGLLSTPPKNLQSRDLTVKVRPKKKVYWTVEEIRKQLGAAHGPMKLHLLLMLNAGFYQSDISDLKKSEINWELGTITRKRSKTKDRPDTPEVTWKLWPEAFELLTQQRSSDRVLALTARSGNPWVTKELREDGKLKKTDRIQSNYRRLCALTGIKRPLKSLRKTSANLLASHKDYARFAGYFLGHADQSIKDRHYVDVPQDLFNEALEWLRLQVLGD